ncbi:hypothetical protein M409DRAFT_22157 [Zasmidium cellare ATCC 36951]|uniref:Uncharacterized protein n=1 Tax=Zasmidium cellare ATCC 36951 TaxID=1080233 RepID=A0A6A6CJD6_ZASCE|nr:uncharacterized protein M409DRAFT_22157 [Zasmidium cellare ATCC 36951]KAF2167347.1 hypothetical protein M409DRAFT_22157 [Zasmidium cellare ATCC 36951]
MDHLARHREYANALTAKYHAATADWQVTHPEAANRFQEFTKLCMAASATPVLAIDLMLLLAKAPTAVLKALQNLSKHFHIEAHLKNELHVSDGGEDAAISIMLPQEIHAARETEIAIQYGPDHAPHVKVEQMTRFGGIGDTDAIQHLPDYDKHYTHLGRRQQVLHIQCNFLIRQQVLVDIKRDRFPITAFEKSYDYFVMEWVLSAYDFLTSRHAVFNKADRKLYNKVTKQLHNYAKTRKWFEIEAMRDEVEQYEKELKEQRARKELGGYDKHAKAELDLNQQLDNCETDFEGFEAIRGLVLGSRWATLADSRKDGNTVMDDGW